VTDATQIRKLRSALSAVIAAASIGVACAAGAQPPSFPHPGTEQRPAPGEAPRAFMAQLPQRRSLSLAEAISIAQSRYPGRVVRAQTIEQGNGAVHEVRIIGTDGRVHTIRVDARTGAVQ
jgi:hypothetical protein